MFLSLKPNSSLPSAPTRGAVPQDTQAQGEGGTESFQSALSRLVPMGLCGTSTARYSNFSREAVNLDFSKKFSDISPFSTQ